ncbi:hypothetical protein ES707_09159 [subsurface metagenome]
MTVMFDETASRTCAGRVEEKRAPWKAWVCSSRRSRFSTRYLETSQALPNLAAYRLLTVSCSQSHSEEQSAFRWSQLLTLLGI